MQLANLSIIKTRLPRSFDNNTVLWWNSTGNINAFLPICQLSGLRSGVPGTSTAIQLCGVRLENVKTVITLAGKGMFEYYLSFFENSGWLFLKRRDQKMCDHQFFYKIEKYTRHHIHPVSPNEWISLFHLLILLQWYFVTSTHPRKEWACPSGTKLFPSKIYKTYWLETKRNFFCSFRILRLHFSAMYSTLGISTTWAWSLIFKFLRTALAISLSE